MLKRSTFKKIRKNAVSFLGAALTVFLLHRGAENNMRTVLGAVSVALCIYGVLFAVDRIIGSVSPIVIDLRTSNSLNFDRCDPYNLSITTRTGSIIELEIDKEDNVELMRFDGRPKRRHTDREFCYLRITNERYIKADPDIAFELVQKIRNDKSTVKVSGLGYQT